MLNRSKLWATSLLVAMFVTGAAVGGGISQAWGGNGEGAGGRAREGGERERPSYAERLDSHLGLDDNQRLAVDSILARREADMHAIWEEVRPKMDALRDTIRTKIMDVLTEEQQERYRDLLERSHRGERERENRNDK